MTATFLQQRVLLRRTKGLACWLLICGVSGCTGMVQQADVSALATEFSAEVETIAAAVTNELKSQGETLAAVQAGNANQTIVFQEELSALRLALKNDLQSCLPQTVSEPKCATQTVEMNADRLVVGELERVRIEPPGIVTVARIDTGAQSSSLHAENVTEFERDGDDWVRFDILDEDQNVTIERPVEKYVRVIQQSDKEGTRRAVVRLRLLIGNVSDSFEFTLADRSHLENVMILGRNFLTDIAVVDVGRQFVQPLANP